jgi:hypothetical protein
MNPENAAQSKNRNYSCIGQKSGTLVQLDTHVPIINKHYWYKNIPSNSDGVKKQQQYNA